MKLTSSIGSPKRRLSLSRGVFNRAPSILIHSSGSGVLRSTGDVQCPTTPAPITSETKPNLLPSQANRVGQELPRRSNSVSTSLLPADTSISSCGTPVGHNNRRRSASSAPPSPAVMSSVLVTSHFCQRPFAKTSTLVPSALLLSARPFNEIFSE